MHAANIIIAGAENIFSTTQLKFNAFYSSLREIISDLVHVSDVARHIASYYTIILCPDHCRSNSHCRFDFMSGISSSS